MNPTTQQPPLPLEALYCRATGRRLAPAQGRAPTDGSPIAVGVFDDGVSISFAGDSVIGRLPGADTRVRAGTAHPVALHDPSRELSRCHVLIRVDRWRVEVVDLGSRNGTAVSTPDGRWRPVLPGIGEVVVDGQQIRLASRVLTVHHLCR